MDVHQLAVPPRSRKSIRELAEQVLEAAGAVRPPFDIVKFMEFLSYHEVFNLDVVDQHMLGDCHGLTLIGQDTILIREDVYLRARDGCGRDRGTMAHELGHWIMHNSVAGLARKLPGSLRARPFECPEWQAKAFQGELLMPARWVGQYADANQASALCKVSQHSAEVQLRALAKDGLYRKKAWK